LYCSISDKNHKQHSSQRKLVNSRDGGLGKETNEYLGVYSSGRSRNGAAALLGKAIVAHDLADAYESRDICGEAEVRMIVGDSIVRNSGSRR
jgi:hypothetical protein